MRLAILLSTVLLVGSAADAFSVGVLLNWGQTCYCESGHLIQHFDCDTNEGGATLTLSFVPPAAIAVNGFRARLVAHFGPDGPPAWWEIGESGCRAGALSVSADGLLSPLDICVDPWQGQATVSHSYRLGAGPIRQGFLDIVGELPAPVALEGDLEYFACQVVIDHRQTTGQSGCGGCEGPVIWGVSSIELLSDSGSQVLAFADASGRQCVWWQGEFYMLCEALLDQGVATRASSWGSLKSIYR